MFVMYACLYLQSREFGEGNEPGEDEEWYYPEGQDYMSLIPRNIAVKVVYNWRLSDVTSLTMPIDILLKWNPRIIQMCQSVSNMERDYRRSCCVE